MLKRERTNFLIVGIAAAAVALLLLVMRIIINLIYEPLAATGISEWGMDLLTDALFTIPVQLIICFLIPLLIYKFAMKKSFGQVFSYSGFRKTKPINFLIVAVLGIAAFFVSSGISSIWLSALEGFGYTQISSATALPDNFNAGVFLANLVLTAFLPAFCEEFFNRGAFLTVLRERFSTPVVILFCGLGFGLFHANIEQFFYTACFGAMLGFIVIKTGSIYPAMIIHFINNAISVSLSFAMTYATGSGAQIIDSLFGGVAFLLIFIFSIPISFLLLFALTRVNRDTKGATPPPSRPLQGYLLIDPETGTVINKSENFEEIAYADIDPFDDTEPVPNHRGFVNVSDIDPFDEGAPPKVKKLYIKQAPIKGKNYYVFKDGKWERRQGSSVRKYETVFFIGAIVVSSLATLFSFIWGFMI